MIGWAGAGFLLRSLTRNRQVSLAKPRNVVNGGNYHLVILIFDESLCKASSIAGAELGLKPTSYRRTPSVHFRRTSQPAVPWKISLPAEHNVHCRPPIAIRQGVKGVLSLSLFFSPLSLNLLMWARLFTPKSSSASTDQILAYQLLDQTSSSPSLGRGQGSLCWVAATPPK